MLGKLLAGLLAALLLVAAVVVYRTVSYAPPAAPKVEPSSLDVDARAVAEHLAQAVRFATVSASAQASPDRAPFAGFVAWLAATYPEVHRELSLEVVGGHSLLFKWQGRDPAAKPGMLIAHYDVVPVAPGTENAWKHPPFAGAVADGYVWGRGTLDDKGALVTILEAATLLVKQGFRPARTIYFAFGHDEEVGGVDGAAAIVERLKSRGVRLAWSLDEGSFVLDGIVPGLSRPVASVNIAEKGLLTLELAAHAEGGHSSMPPGETAIDILANALVAMRRSPLPGGLDGATGEVFDGLARHMKFEMRLLFANRWLAGGLLERELSKSPATNAMLRTTTAPTILAAGVRENVLPIDAKAIVNFRVHPRDTPESVHEHVKASIADARVSTRVLDQVPASRFSSTGSPAFRAIGDAVRRVYADAVVVPGITIVSTDSKRYGEVTDDAYRFHPMVVAPPDLPTVHGTDERISVENLVRATRFYAELMRADTR